MRLEAVGKTLGLIIRIEQTPKAEVETRRKEIGKQTRDNELQAMRNFCAFFQDPAMVKKGESFSSLGVQVLGNFLVPQYHRASREATQVQAGLLPVKPVASIVLFNRLRWAFTPKLPQVPKPISPYQPL